MQLPTILLLLAATSLGAAVPTAVLDSPVEVNITAPLMKRDSLSCDVPWPRLTEPRVRDIANKLSGDPVTFSASTGEQSQVLYCVGGTGVVWSVDAQDPPYTVVFASADVANIIYNAFYNCYGHYPSGGDTTYNDAYQYWGQGWNLLVRGSQC